MQRATKLLLVLFGLGVWLSGEIALADALVTDYSNHDIVKIGPDGTQSIFASGLGYPTWMAPDGKGNLFVSDSAGILYKYTSAGVPSVFANVWGQGLAFDKQGNLFDGTGSTITEFAPDGSQSTFASGLNVILGLAFDSSGNLFAADQNGGLVYKFTPDGNRTIFASVNTPEGLAFDHSGNLFVTDYFTGYIWEYTPDGKGSIFASGLSGPHGLAFDGHGNLFAADSGSGNIYEFAPDGSRSTFASGFSWSVGVVVPEPSSFALLGAGVIGLLGYIWRRRGRA